MKTFKICTLITMLLFICVASKAQEDWQTYFDALVADEEIDAETVEHLHDVLSELVQTPININTADYDELKSMQILDNRQISEIMKYRDIHGTFKDLQELRMMSSIDRNRCELLMCLVYIGDAEAQQKLSLKDAFKYGKSELMFTMKAPLYKRKGNKDGYLGDKYQHSLRYLLSYEDKIKIGFVGSKDAGEPFFKGKNGAGYDFYSVFVSLRNIKSWRQVTVGRYKLRTGMGLIMNTYFGFGKTTLLTSLLSDRTMVAGYTSKSEADYLQGAMATLKIAMTADVTVFASARKIDATLNNDSTIRTVLTTGYHRTQSEMDRRRNAWLSVGGANFAWHSGGWHAGASALVYGTNKEILPDTRQTYRKYYLNGKNFWNISADYGYTSARLQVDGETATGSSGGVATINSVSFEPTGSFELTAVQRFYSYRYNAFFAKSFSEGGHVQNESGVMIGVLWNMNSAVQLSAYSDYAYFPWARYLVSKASHTWDNMIELTARSGSFSIDARYRVKMKQRDIEAKDNLTDYAEHRARLRFGYEADFWNIRVQGDMTHSSFGDGSTGWMVSCMPSVKVAQWLKLYANAGYFNTDDYNSRIYVYERSMLYTFSFPMFYGEGIRYAMSAEARFGKSFIFTLKAGTTDYFDRDHVSDGLQQVDRSALTDIECQLRIKF